jgi:prolyl oligopeptidase
MIIGEVRNSRRNERCRVFLHLLGSNPETDQPVFGCDVSPSVPVDPADIPFVALMPGTDWVVGIIAHGVRNEITAYVAPVAALGRPSIPWKKVCDVEDAVTGLDAHGDELFLLSHKDASRFKVLRTSLSKPDIAKADLIVPPGEPVLRNLAAAADALYVQSLDGGIGRLLRVPYGSKPEAVALPFNGAVNLSATDPRVPGTLLAMTSWTRAMAIYAYDPESKQTTDTGLQPVGPNDAPADLESVEVKAKSEDGTMVPLSITHRKGIKCDGSNPTLLEGYGSYGISEDPAFDPLLLAWYELGGIFAVAHVRGGGEYGEDWHQAGKGLTKPNTWKDFIACGQYLIDQKYTDSARLAGLGGSAGGITIGRSIAERPDLFAAVIDAVPASDMLRMESQRAAERTGVRVYQD